MWIVLLQEGLTVWDIAVQLNRSEIVELLIANVSLHDYNAVHYPFFVEIF